MTGQNTRRIDLAGLLMALLLFTVLGLWRLNLPGLYEDEALDVVPAVRSLRGYAPWPYELLPGRLGIPLMVSDHVGPTSTYLVLPFLLTLGVNQTAVRVYEFAVAFIGIVLVFVWARRVLPRGAWLAPLLLAAMPSFWLGGRNGIHVSFVLVPIITALFICLGRWRASKDVRWFSVALFLVGVGIATKILFLWVIAALALGMLTMARPLLRQLRVRNLAKGAMWFVVGCSPFIAFVALSRGLIFKTILQSLGETPYGVKNRDVVANLAIQIHAFVQLLEGSWLTWTGRPLHNPVAPLLFAAAVVYLLLRRRQPEMYWARVVLLTVVVVTLASCFTISTLGPKHLVVLLPLLPVVVVGAIGGAWTDRNHPLSRAALALLAPLAVLQFGWDLANSVRYHQALSGTGGVGLFSTAHNELARFLVSQGITAPLTLDWGMQSNLEVLSAGRVRSRSLGELREAAPYPSTRRQIRAALHEPATVFLAHPEAIAAAPGRFQLLLSEADQQGISLVSLATFYDGNGDPIVGVYTPRRIPSAGVHSLRPGHS